MDKLDLKNIKLGKRIGEVKNQFVMIMVIKSLKYLKKIE